MLISNLMLLLFAGMDTTSTILAVCMHCLATNPRVQDRLYEEISEVLSDGELNYNGVQVNYLSPSNDKLELLIIGEISHIKHKQRPASIQALPYLDMVVYETLRFWPLGDLERKCVKDYRNTFHPPRPLDLNRICFFDKCPGKKFLSPNTL